METKTNPLVEGVKIIVALIGLVFLLILFSAPFRGAWPATEGQIPDDVGVESQGPYKGPQ